MLRHQASVRLERRGLRNHQQVSSEASGVVRMLSLVWVRVLCCAIKHCALGMQRHAQPPAGGVHCLKVQVAIRADSSDCILHLAQTPPAGAGCICQWAQYLQAVLHSGVSFAVSTGHSQAGESHTFHAMT